jgi:dodecin
MAPRKTSKPMFSAMRIGQIMTTVAKVIELTASSPKSIEDAIESGIKRADTTLDQIESAWVQDIKCVVKNGKVSEWRVNMKITFLLK